MTDPWTQMTYEEAKALVLLVLIADRCDHCRRLMLRPYGLKQRLKACFCGACLVVGHTREPLGRMEPGYVYAPYIPEFVRAIMP